MSGHADTIRVYRHDVPGSGSYSVASIEVVKKSDYDALVAENQEQAKVLTWISDPSYVGNYSCPEIVEIHRKWARAALADTPSEDTE